MIFSPVLTVVVSSLTSPGVVWGSGGVRCFVVVLGFGVGAGLLVVVIGLRVVVVGLFVGVETSENIRKTLILT